MELQRVLEAFPPIAFSFAYGSGVFGQQGYSSKDRPMVDFVFAVDDAATWHAANISSNPHHYSAWARTWPSAAAVVHQYGGAAMYYNTLVPLPVVASGGVAGQTMKYGVISVRDFLDDLLHWRTLYVSGRMHKPVLILQKGPAALMAAARENLRHAVRAALLQLPGTFSATDLYTTIAGLSYTGDFRMVFGENPHKVTNIVTKNLNHFHDLYKPVLESSFPTVQARGMAGLPSDVSALQGTRLSQDTSPEARLALAMALPLSLQKRMAAALFAERTGSSFYRLVFNRRRGIDAAPSEDDSSPATRWWRRRADMYNALRDRSSRSLSTVVQMAESGREIMARLRAQRLQWVIGRRMRASRNDVATGADGVSASEEARNVMESDASSGTFSRAAQDPELIAFWDEMLRRANKVNGAHSALARAWLPRNVPGVAGDVAFPTQRYLRPAIANIVGPAARVQSLKGILTAGPSKAVLYVASKLSKYFKAVLA